METVMLQIRRLAAAAAAFSLFAASATLAQSMREGLPPGSTIYPVHFPSGSYQLDPADQDTIRAVVSKLKADPALIAAIVGKTDATGSAEFNQHLSERRAQTVFEALVYANNAPQEKVEVYWTGEHLPIVSTADEQAESQNRVVAIALHKAQ
jgi:outer membrane protein OmpA-like peptidoglycan-associated protein